MASMPSMAEASRDTLAEFLIAVSSGLTTNSEQTERTGRLSDERDEKVTARLRALEAARQRAEVASRDYHVR